VSRGAEDAKDAVSDAGDKLKNAGSSASDDSEGQLKKAQKNVSRAAEDAKDNVQVRGGGWSDEWLCISMQHGITVGLARLTIAAQLALHTQENVVFYTVCTAYAAVC
jgi:uncharacterized protein YjbJ (UPF0337 family)